MRFFFRRPRPQPPDPVPLTLADIDRWQRGNPATAQQLLNAKASFDEGVKAVLSSSTEPTPATFPAVAFFAEQTIKLSLLFHGTPVAIAHQRLRSEVLERVWAVRAHMDATDHWAEIRAEMRAEVEALLAQLGEPPAAPAPPTVERAETMKAAILAAINKYADELAKLPSERAKARFLAERVGCGPGTARKVLADERRGGGR